MGRYRLRVRFRMVVRFRAKVSRVGVSRVRCSEVKYKNIVKVHYNRRLVDKISDIEQHDDKINLSSAVPLRILIGSF